MKQVLFILAFLMLCSTVFGATTTILYEPYTTTLRMEQEFAYSFPGANDGTIVNSIKAATNTKSCYDAANWQTKACDYLYFCYAILPEGSTRIWDALDRQCIDVTETYQTTSINQFVPPKGTLYYVTTFMTKVHATCNQASCTSTTWNYETSFPYVNAHPIRAVCPEGQMLKFNDGLGKYECYISERICLDALNTGMCTNAYNLYALDIYGAAPGSMSDGVVSQSEMNDPNAICADRPVDNNNDGVAEMPFGDGKCDTTADWSCVDAVTRYSYDTSNNQFVVQQSGPNNVCDEWDKAALKGCADDVLSPNSKICDNIDSSLCGVTYSPVCVGGQGGTTYPNECYAKAQGETSYTAGACTPGIVQCYAAFDCPDLNVCVGGAFSDINKQCLNNMCEYTGACQNLQCQSDADCTAIAQNTCVGISGVCTAGVCTVSGSCLEPPQNKGTSIWNLIAAAWDTFWTLIRNIIQYGLGGAAI